MAPIDYDIIIVGGGLCALSAAMELQGYRALVLEKNAQIGGRVFTKQQQGIPYDLGGLFAPNAEVLPTDFFKKINSTPFSETLGIHYDNQVYWGTKVVDCLNKVGLSRDEKQEIRQFFRDKDGPTRDLSKKPYQLLNAFFQLIHPGSMDQYVTGRKYDALIRWQLAYLKQGNGTLIDFLREQTRAEVQTQARVTGITEEDYSVRVHYTQHGIAHQVTARKVIVTTPAPIVAQLVSHMNEASETFLNGLEYQGGFTLVIAVPSRIMKEFAFVVTPDFNFASVLQQQRSDEVSLLTIYFTGAAAEQVRKKDTRVVVQECLPNLQWAVTTSLEFSDLIFYDGHYWPHISPVINEAYDGWSALALNPSPNVHLAGDYTWYSPLDPMPYGMTAAVLAGQRTAGIVSKALPAPHRELEGQYLLQTQVYRLLQDRPIYQGQSQEGDIAYYGILLAAGKDERIKNYLLACAKDGLWEYQDGFGVTLDDSLLVTEGLWRAGWDHEELKYSLDQLIRFFYDEQIGAFHTLSPRAAEYPNLAKGRAKYWKGPCVEGTAQAAWLLSIFEQDYSSIISRCQEYLAKTQHPLGFWPSKWFPSLMWGTHYGLQLCLKASDQYATEIARASKFIINAQQANGSWQDSALETSFAVRSLKALQYDEQHDYIRSATNWLQHQIHNGQLAGEPLLYYWYEEGGTKLLHQAFDTGGVTRALVQLALEEQPFELQKSKLANFEVL